MMRMAAGPKSGVSSLRIQMIASVVANTAMTVAVAKSELLASFSTSGWLLVVPAAMAMFRALLSRYSLRVACTSANHRTMSAPTNVMVPVHTAVGTAVMM